MAEQDETLPPVPAVMLASVGMIRFRHVITFIYNGSCVFFQNRALNAHNWTLYDHIIFYVGRELTGFVLVGFVLMWMQIMTETCFPFDIICNILNKTNIWGHRFLKNCYYCWVKSGLDVPDHEFADLSYNQPVPDNIKYLILKTVAEKATVCNLR